MSMSRPGKGGGYNRMRSRVIKRRSETLAVAVDTAAKNSPAGLFKSAGLC